MLLNCLPGALCVLVPRLVFVVVVLVVKVDVVEAVLATPAPVAVELLYKQHLFRVGNIVFVSKAAMISEK